MGIVFQKPNPFPKSIYENVAYGLRIQGVNKRRQLDETVEWALKASAATLPNQLGKHGYLVRIDDLSENTEIFNQLIANIPSTDFSNTRAADGGGGFIRLDRSKR